jgi:hypothetical protein
MPTSTWPTRCAASYDPSTSLAITRPDILTLRVVSSALQQVKMEQLRKPHRKEATHGTRDQRHVHLARRIRHRPQ